MFFFLLMGSVDVNPEMLDLNKSLVTSIPIADEVSLIRMIPDMNIKLCWPVESLVTIVIWADQGLLHGRAIGMCGW